MVCIACACGMCMWDVLVDLATSRRCVIDNILYLTIRGFNESTRRLLCGGGAQFNSLQALGGGVQTPLGGATCLEGGVLDPPLQSVTLGGGSKTPTCGQDCLEIAPKSPQNTPSSTVWEPSDPPRAGATLRGEGAGPPPREASPLGGGVWTPPRRCVTLRGGRGAVS